MLSRHQIRALSVLAVALMLSVTVIPAVSQEATAANPGGTVNIQPGQTWNWTPTFPAGLSPTLKVSASASSMPADNATFATTSGNAKIVSGKVQVTIPADFTGSAYYVKLQAKTTQPSQTAYYEITFSVATYTLTYSATKVVAKVGTAISDITPTIGGGVSAKSYAISGTLPAGLSLNKTTGVISGTPTAYKAQTNYTITATLNTTPVQTITATVSIGAFTNISATSYTIYAIQGKTSITGPAVTMPTGTTLKSMTATAKVDGTADSTFQVGTAFHGMTVAASTGKVTGTPDSVGTFVFTETFKATDATGGSQATRTITVVSDHNVASKSYNNSDIVSYEGKRDVLDILEDSGLTLDEVTLNIRSVAVNGVVVYHSGESQSETYQMFDSQSYDPSQFEAYSQVGESITNKQAGYSFDPFSQTKGTVEANPSNFPTVLGLGSASSANKVITGTLPAGDYTVTVRILTKNTTSTSSGATGASPSSNFKDVTFNITNHDLAAFTPVDPNDSTKYGSTFYMATNKVYDALTVKAAGNFSSSFTFSIDSYGSGITSSNIKITSAGVVQPNSAAVTTAGNYTVVLKVQDPDISSNSATITLPVVVKNALTFLNGTTAGAITS